MVHTIPLTLLSNSEMNAEIKIAAVAKDVGEINRVVFEMNKIKKGSSEPGSEGGAIAFQEFQVIETP